MMASKFWKISSDFSHLKIKIYISSHFYFLDFVLNTISHNIKA